MSAEKVSATSENCCPGGNTIDDPQFFRALTRLKSLRSFLIEQAVEIKPSENVIISFGELNLLRFSEKGRCPSKSEWQALEQLTQALFAHLDNETLRRRFIFTQLPWWIVALVCLLGLSAFSALPLALFTTFQPIDVLPYYLLWLVSLGAIGSVAFIGMNALAVQDDATFDVSNNKLLALRIVLGALFGVVLTLPFGFPGFINFLKSLGNPETFDLSASGIASDSLLLLSPFLLGFSTPLVIMILNQFVEALQSFFGRRPAAASPKTPRKDQAITSVGPQADQKAGKSPTVVGDQAAA